MPGGSRKGWDLIKPILRKIAADVGDGPCVTYIGPGMCVCTYICIYTCVCVCVYIYLHIYMCVCLRVLYCIILCAH